MKAKLFFTALMIIGFWNLSLAQRGHRNGHYNDNHTSYRYSNYGNSYHYNTYDRYANRMNKHDRKRLRKLTRRLQERERCAWEDGYVSRRERRRIREVQNDIDDLLSYYRRNDRYNRSYDRKYRPVCR